MKERKYTLGLFLIDFIINILFHFFWLFIPGVIFMIIGNSVKWCLYVGIDLLLIDATLSFVKQMQNKNAMLPDSDNATEHEPNEADEDRLNQAKKLYDEINRSIEKGLSLEEIVNCFQKMCETPIDNDSILFETGIFNFTDGKEHFYFSLVRQFSNGNDEYYQIHVDVLYPPTKENKKFNNSKWSDCLDENIFDYIRKSPAFAYCRNNEYVNIKFDMDET